jgi:hypothetical protein
VETDSFYINNKEVIVVESKRGFRRWLTSNVFLHGVNKLLQRLGPFHLSDKMGKVQNPLNTTLV